MPRIPILLGLGSVGVVGSVAAAPAVVDEPVEPLEVEPELEEPAAEPVVEPVEDPVDDPVVDPVVDAAAEPVVDEAESVDSSVLGGGGTNMTARMSIAILRSRALAN